MYQPCAKFQVTSKFQNIRLPWPAVYCTNNNWANMLYLNAYSTEHNCQYVWRINVFYRYSCNSKLSIIYAVMKMGMQNYMWVLVMLYKLLFFFTFYRKIRTRLTVIAHPTCQALAPVAFTIQFVTGVPTVARGTAYHTIIPIGANWMRVSSK